MQACNHGMSPVSLRKVFPEALLIGATDYVLLNCTSDVRRLSRGDAFVAIFEPESDGYAKIAEAIARGAGVIIAERIPDEISSVGPHGQVVPFCLVENARQAYAKLCQALFHRPGDHLQLVGVTGTSGKTTTACLIAGALGAAEHGVGMVGSLGCFDGEDASRKTTTTPTPKRLGSWLARMHENDCSHAVIEVSSMALDQYRIDGLEFRAICLTNVRCNHLDYHETLDEYRKAKMRIFEYMAPDGFTVLNMDDPISAEVTKWLDIPSLTFGMERPAEVTGMIIEQYLSEQTALITAGRDTLPLRTRIVGRPYIYNCLAAISVALGMGVDLHTAIRGIETIDSVPGRMERLDCGQPFGVFVDYAHSPDALAHTLRAMMEIVEGKIICVYGAPGDGNTACRAEMGEILERYADTVILTDHNPMMEPPAAITDEILAGFCRPGDVCVNHDRVEAIHLALELAEPGDCVFIAGKGNGKLQLVAGEGRKHDDREVARKWLYRNAKVDKMGKSA